MFALLANFLILLIIVGALYMLIRLWAPDGKVKESALIVIGVVFLIGCVYLLFAVLGHAPLLYR